MWVFYILLNDDTTNQSLGQGLLKSPSTRKQCLYTPRVIDDLSFVLKSNRDKTILAVAKGENHNDKCHKDIIELEGCKHEDYMAIQSTWLKKHKKSFGKLLKFKGRKMQANKNTLEGLIMTP